MSTTTNKSSFPKLDHTRLAAILAKAREGKKQSVSDPTTSTTKDIPSIPTASPSIGIHGEAITYNAQQLRFIETATRGESCILVGAAGTGKTTCTRGAILSLIQSGRAGLLHNEGHKYIGLSSGSPGIVATSYTRRAVANLKRALPSDMQGNCVTLHKLLEYQPIFYDMYDPITGEDRKTMKFEATRHALRPLSPTIHTIIIDESSMVSVELYKELMLACPHNPQVIFLGDIQQLPPVFGSAILGFKMLELPTIELTEVYRQALESPIIKLAHRILSGSPINVSEFNAWKAENKLTLHPWKKKLSPDIATFTLAKFFTNAIAQNVYSPEEDMILIPYNKACGTEELNKHIANYLAKQERKEVYEIIAGFRKVYLHVGAKVLYDKEDAIILAINPNPAYLGKSYQSHSFTLDYWGHNSGTQVSAHETHEYSNLSDEAVDMLLEQAAADNSDRVKIASHSVQIRMLDSDETLTLDRAADVNSMLLGYTLTVHKSQGSEWRKVFLCLHQSHATMLQRELLYTAVTRAREELYVICEPDSFEKGILGQRIKGNTLEAKAEFFKGKLESNGGTY